MVDKSFSIDFDGIDELAKDLDPKRLLKGKRNAANRTATDVARLGVDEAAKVYNIKKGRIKKDSRGNELVRKVRARAGESTAKVIFGTNRKGDRPGLQHFGPNKKMVNRGKSPKVRIKKGGALEIVDRGFFQTIKSARGLFQREGSKRYPIVRRTGPSTKQMIGDENVFKHIEAEGGKALQWHLLMAIDKQLRR